MIGRGEAAWPGMSQSSSRLAGAPWALLAAYWDFAYVAGLALVFWALIRLAPRPAPFVYALFLGIGFFSVALAVANRQIVGWLGRPLTYQWLYYSDFLRSQEARNAILAELSARQIALTVVGLAALPLLARVLLRVVEATAEKFGGHRLAGALLLVALAYFSIGAVALSRLRWDPYKIANPVVFLARSVAVRRPAATLLARKTRVGTEDFQPTPAVGAPSAGRVRNVVLFVLESVAAQYTDPYGARWGATPHLESARSHALLVRNAYAHCPTTPSSLASLLLSIYPSLSFQSLTQEHPAVRFPSLPSVLSERGYRTAFFSSADDRFQKGDVFLAHRRFERIADYRTLPCSGSTLHASSSSFPYLDGMDDICAVDALRAWLPAGPSGAPFFAVVWTMMTHFPYFAAGPERDFHVPDRAFNRYLNGLARGDEALGRLLRTLEERGLSGSTLVIVVGDHGETFGQHHQRGHGLKIYEENLHVPLLLICPALFHGERVDTVAGMIDVAPTALELVGAPAPGVWQGRSLFRSDRAGRVYFYAPFSDNLFGFRDGNRKFIYSASYDQSEVYDLAADPGELRNLAAQSPEFVRLGQDRLAAWAQYQDRFVGALFAGGS